MERQRLYSRSRERSPPRVLGGVIGRVAKHLGSRLPVRWDVGECHDERRRQMPLALISPKLPLPDDHPAPLKVSAGTAGGHQAEWDNSSDAEGWPKFEPDH